jgi:hypothetical protein
LRIHDHFLAGRLNDAEKLAATITQEFAAHPFDWKALGAILGKMDRVMIGVIFYAL